MTSINPAEKFINRYSLLTLWPLILLTPFVPFPAPSLLLGHPWKPELFLSLLLIAVITVLFLQAQKKFSFAAVMPIAISLAAFVLWSGASTIWAGSVNSVWHHTAVWAVYPIFFAILSTTIHDKRFFKNSVYVLGAVALIISANCVIEYLLRERVDSTFGFRYARFSEVFAALIPLFTALTIRLRGLKMALSVLVISLAWLAVLFSTSRTSLAAAVAGLGIFFVTLLITKKGRVHFRKLALVGGLLLMLVIVTQLPTSGARNESKATTFDRIAITSESDAGNSIDKNIRFLFAAVGAEMLRQNPIFGVGADNFGIEFNKYRAAVSAIPDNAALVTGNEEAIPERAHNEYLQVATELGVVGASLFAIFLIAVIWLGVRSLRESANIYKLAAAAGMTAFLFSSLFSSFSFRLVQNGVVFFFLAALLVAKRPAKPQNNRAVLLVALAACVCVALFSSLKAASQYMAYRGEASKDVAASLADLSVAERLDDSNAAANYLAASKLLNNARYGEAAVQFRTAIDKGIGTTATYSYLISAHSLGGNDQAALDAAADAVRVFPYSPFLLARYSALLEKAGKSGEADTHFARAQTIDTRQADTWKLFITQGARLAAEAGRQGVGVPLMADLYPQDGLYAMLAERQIIHPDERYTFLAQ